MILRQRCVATLSDAESAYTEPFLRGRISCYSGGVRFGRTVGRGTFYGHVNVLSELLGDYGFHMTHKGEPARYDSGDFRDTWVEYGIGATWRFSDSVSGHFDVMRSTHFDFEEDYKWSAGVKFEF